MKLNMILEDIEGCIVKGNKHIDISSIAYNSKQVQPGGIFFAIKGLSQNGCDFIDEAIERGAVCIAAREDFITYKNITKVIMPHIRKACAIAAANYYKHPSGRVHVTGITGTNGKTTTLYMTKSIMQQAGINCGSIGTINYSIGQRLIPATNTTPSSIMLQMFLSEMESAGIGNCVMEVSSHALDQDRVESISFKRAIFTNLSGEHLDYHKNMERYFLSKNKLFSLLEQDGAGIVNIDDKYGRQIQSLCKSRMVTYGIKTPADVNACEIKNLSRSTTFKVKSRDLEFMIESPIIGEHNVYNMLAAIAWALSLDISPSIIKSAMKEFKPAPGRMERLNSPRSGPSIFVDYAHTDNALLHALKALQAIKQKRIITVFGCGGDRDKKKRPRMGKVAAGFSDYIIVTSDNPRSENPSCIIQDIVEGIPKGFDSFKVIVDRKKAIEYSLHIAGKEDIILIAGKGHESYQVLKDTTIVFDDRKVAREALENIAEMEIA